MAVSKNEINVHADVTTANSSSAKYKSDLIGDVRRDVTLKGWKIPFPLTSIWVCVCVCGGEIDRMRGM